MRTSCKTTLVVLALVLSACETKTPRAATVPPPQPATAKAEAPQEPPSVEPISIPQTQVQLPSPQPIDPQALATPPMSVPGEPAKSHQSRQSKKQAPQPASPAGKGETEAAETPPPTETQRPLIAPVLSDDERRRLNEDIASRLKDVDLMLGRLVALRLSDGEKDSVEKIRSFQKLAREAMDHGEIQQASGLAERAVLLAQEVLRGR